MNPLDRVINWISPSAGLKREIRRAQTEVVKTFRNSGYSHSGASRKKKSMQGWESDSRTPAEDIGGNLALLRERSRDLYMGGGLATSAIRKNATNVVGSGLTLKCRLNYEALGLTEEEARAWADQTELEFELWASQKIDNTGLNDFYDAQRIALIGWLMNGDSLALIKYDRPTSTNPYRLRLHLLEADRLSTPNLYAPAYYGASSLVTVQFDFKQLDNGNTIQNGVEIDRFGKVVAYWIANRHPNSLLPYREPVSWVRVDAINRVNGIPNVLFIMDAERAEQYRGVPYLAPVIEQIKQINRYTEAEIAAAIINSFFSAFITTAGPKNDIPIGQGIPENDQIPLPLEDRLSSYELGPGTINALGPGESVSFGDPKHPTSGFDVFVKSVAQFTGASLDIPYEVLLGMFNSSYSASRAALLQAWQVFRNRRDWFAYDFCQPVYEAFLFEAVATGRIKAPGFFEDPMKRKLWTSAAWIGPSPGQIDPVKEVAAAEARIKNGLSSHEQEALEINGSDYRANIAKLRREYEEGAGVVGVPAGVGVDPNAPTDPAAGDPNA